MSEFLENVSPDQLAVLAAAAGIAISDGLNADELNSLGNFLLTVGEMMLLIAAQQSLLDNRN